MSELTSIVSYRQCQDEGLFGQRQMEIVEFMVAHQHEYREGISQGDVGRHYNDASSGYQPRFKELEDSGVVRCIGTKYDEITDRTVKAYVLTGQLPTEKVRARPKPVLCPHCGEDIKKAPPEGEATAE